MTPFDYDICIIGGGGHIGLPLGVAFANAGLKVVLFDLNEGILKKINSGVFPFKENNGEENLKKALARGMLKTFFDPAVISACKTIVTVIGTPIDEYFNPDFLGVNKAIEGYIAHFRDGQTFILRSTVYPGTTERIDRYFKEQGKNINVAFCPERIVEGNAFEELKNIPQIVSSFDQKVSESVGRIFELLTNKQIIYAKPIEAELSKIFCNAWRYTQFAIANQFFMTAEKYGLNYRNIYNTMTKDYKRMSALYTPGFSAGPCLLKDTMQLLVFNNNEFMLGQASINVNEGLPKFIIEQLKKKYGEDLKNKTVGILGMTFKAESDDIRDSLSFKLRKVALIECNNVYCHDFYYKNEYLCDLDYVLDKADIIILATPHKKYKDIDIKKYKNKEFVDIWHFWD